MAQLYFRYSTMNAGKSLEILKIANNYEEQDKTVLLMTSHLDTRQGLGRIVSRVGLSRTAEAIFPDTNLLKTALDRQPVDCVLIDEGQFLTRRHVTQLCQVVDQLNIPVIVYGLRADFRNELFEGSEALFCLADKIEEVKTVCWFCNRKATMNMRIAGGKPVRTGDQILIGGNESYLPVCRRHYLDETLDLREFGFFDSSNE
ncbi:thymidine kinase [Candidatus Sumerlaeota bacterium]|nr:thymidine kinase [Candidatus Sumerlaeota bacterium]